MQGDQDFGAGRIDEPAMATLARLTEIVATQQHEMTRLLQNQQQVLERMATPAPPGERRVEGISMPTYRGDIGESLQVYLKLVRLYLRAKNIDVNDPANQARLIAMVASNLRGQAAAWYTFHEGEFATLDELAAGLDEEFVPPDLQERLRTQLFELKQTQCKTLEAYVAKFRHIISQVRDMSSIDQITWFVHGLVTRTREEVAYRRCATLSKAISVALEFERAHPNRSDRPAPRAREPERAVDTAEPMEIDNVNVRNFNTLSREECRRRNLCFRCKRPGHRMNDCRARLQPQRSRHTSRPRNRTINAVELYTPTLTDAPASDTMTFRSYEVNMAKVVRPSTDHLLIRKRVKVNGHTLTALIDCGANHNMIRPGIATWLEGVHLSSVEGFDGRVQHDLELREVRASVSMDGVIYNDVLLTEYDLPTSHDVILGKPWLTRFNPTIDWRTHAIKVDWTTRDTLDDLSEGYIYRYEKEYPGETARQWYPPAQDGDEYSFFHVKVTANKPGPEPSAAIALLLDGYKDVFPEHLPTGLPPERQVEFELNLKPDARPSSRAPFRLSKTEQDALQLFVDDLLEKQWIELSDSPWVSNVFGVPKKDQKTGKQQSRAEWIRSGDPTSPIRWVVDYRYLNSQTLVPKIPLPNIEELFDRMARAHTYSLLDLANGYHQMRVKPSTRPYTAFRTGAETYQWCVAPMGVAGMPGIWSRLMRLLFGKFDFVVVYLDDICIFSASEEEHERHLRLVFDVLRREKLFARREKCSFAQSSVKFLGHTISHVGLEVDKTKTTAIEQWKTPTTVKELQSFLGLAGYYRRFIHRFADIVLPLSDLVKKDRTWEWTAYQENAFLVIKAALQQAPILRLPDFDEQFVVTTDASRLCCGAVLSQRHDGFDHPIAFYSKKFGRHELNWPAHEKELYAIKLALSKWRHYLHGRQFLVYTDNIACRWFLNHPTVSPKLARWLDFFSQFDFELHHVKGVQNIVADALSRHVPDDDVPITVEDRVDTTANDDVNDRLDADNVELSSAGATHAINSVVVHSCTDACHAAQRLIAERQLVMNELASRNSYDLHLLLDDHSRGVGAGRAAAVAQRGINHVVNSVTRRATTVVLAPRSRDEFVNGYDRDAGYSSLADGTRRETTHGVQHRRDGLVYLEGDGGVERVCVPNDYELRTKILAEFHDGAAHPGIPRTLAKLQQWYFWEELEQDVNDYVRSCLNCAKFKVSSTKKKGKLLPLDVPSECWQHVGLDYITGLPSSNGFDCIQVAVDLLSKRAKYAPMHTTATASECARVFFDSVVRHHGLPHVIVSDRDPRFTGAFWAELMKLMNVKLHMTTAHRAQADGQVERQNRVLEDSLRCLTSVHGDDWADLLGTIEYAHATLVSASTGLTPFEIDCGRKASNPLAQPHATAERRERQTKAEFAKQFAERRRAIVERAQQALLDAKQRQKKYYDKRRAEADFKAGDLVLLKTENLSRKKVTHNTTLQKVKLSAQYVGPFEIQYMVHENVARLKLPKKLRDVHPSFNVELLIPYPEQPDRFRTRPRSKETPIETPDAVDDDNMRVIERLVRKRQFNRKPEYLVKWLGEPMTECTWEREKDIKHVVHWPRLIKELREQHRAKGTSTTGECQPQLLAPDQVDVGHDQHRVDRAQRQPEQPQLSTADQQDPAARLNRVSHRTERLPAARVNSAARLMDDGFRSARVTRASASTARLSETAQRNESVRSSPRLRNDNGRDHRETTVSVARRARATPPRATTGVSTRRR